MSLLFRRWPLLLTTVGAASLLACSGSDAKSNDACTPDDADGIIDEPVMPQLTVSDTEFLPKIVTAQNSSHVTLELLNAGTKPHSFVVDCKPTPNSDGCPMQSCFPSEARIDPIAPGARVTVEFVSPLVEGIYDFHSDVPEDTELAPGQFVIQ
ncbi:MAG TPA: hypothetical protein VFK05_24890 [Polyangiaceae bacterium]|nr:hypothetical protein [Polyangiaceae bacterium]